MEANFACILIRQALINNCNKLFHSSDLSNNLLRRIPYNTFKNMDKLEIM